eukprot:NODE_188_length_2224_cov_123.742989_g161_i0.p1 GENE.NODE_188_length_2224_cov_123.742989_g161_i0~~NODE_188_length_2224_cov_123.742989_g161_i0.p1  ORF type:complete len:420 (-),score=159.33 NODE_188_length_2224_cov_123.742989_g161_i0:106-1365(-)
MLSKGIKESERRALEDINNKLELITKLDRYPETSMEQLVEYANTLEKKWEGVQEVLQKEYCPEEEFNAEYFETSPFPILHVYSGCVAALPDGDVPPGSIEIMPGQVLMTKVNGEEVALEVDDVNEGTMMLWFKDDIPLPSEAKVMWEYPVQRAHSNEVAGTVWEEAKKVKEDDVAKFVEVPVEVEEEAMAVPTVPVINNSFAALVEKINNVTSAEHQAKFSEALLHPLPTDVLEAEYASHWDREVVESKRDRIYSALQRAHSAAVVPFPVDPIRIKLESTVTKCELVDFLRQQEFLIGEEKLQARLLMRRIDGEHIPEEEALDYSPFVRDDTELSHDYAAYEDSGRYLWRLFPHVAEDPDCLLKDLRFFQLPEDTHPQNGILAKQLKSTPLHKELERRVMLSIGTPLVAEEMKKKSMEL